MAKYCSYCGAVIHEGNRYCQKCGKPFPEPCPQCGAPVFDTKFCPECGYKLEPLLSVEESDSGIYEEVSSDISASKLEEPVYRSPRQTGNTSYTTEQDYSPFEVGSTPASSAFETGSSKKPLYKKWWFWLIAGLVVLGIIVSVAGGDGKVDISSNQEEETSSVSISSKKERDGFNEETNNEYEIGGIRYSVPDYFGEVNKADDSIQLFAENDDGAVMLQFNSYDNVNLAPDEVYPKLDEAFDSCLTDLELRDSQQVGSEKTTLAGLPAKHYTAHGKSAQMDDADLTADVTLGYDDEAHMSYSVLLLQSGDTEYSYNNDYKKIVESAVKTAKSDSSGSVSASVKEALDSYEAFVDEYIAFMQNFENSSDTTGMLTDYMDYITRLTDLSEKMDSMKEDDMSDADMAYYTEVMLRCSQKMLQAAG